MNRLVKLLAMVSTWFAPPALSGALQVVATIGSQGLVSGNRCAPGANAAFRRAAAKARRMSRG